MDFDVAKDLLHISGSNEKLIVQNGPGDCQQNHEEMYIPARDISLEKLPEEIRSKETLDAIITRCKLTVNIRGHYVSEKRPDFYSDTNELYPMKQEKGRDYKHCGTGVITNILTADSITGGCPCRSCSISSSERKWWQLIVCTATHVIFNEEEAKRAVFECFYDDEENESNIGNLYGSGIQYSITRMDELHTSDLCEVICVTHDEKTVKRIAEVFKEIEKNPDLAKQPSEVIVSHPHGESKKISFGKVWHLTVPINDEFQRNTPINFKNHTKYRLSQESDKDTSCNMDNRAGTPTPEVEGESFCNSKKDNATEKDSKKDTASYSIAKLLHEPGFKNYVTIYLIAGFEAWMTALKFMSTLKTDLRASQDKVIKHVFHNLKDIKSTVKAIKDFKGDKKEKISEIYDTILESYGKLQESCTDEVFSNIQNEIINIFYPQVGDLIFKQDKSTITWQLGTQTDKQNYEKAFIVVIDFYKQVFEGVQPELDIIIHYIEKEFGNMMHLTISYMRKAMFSSIRKCPTYTVNLNQNPELELMLPAGATFTLPKDAKYAFRYYEGVKGWVKFPPGTQFAYTDGTPLNLPDDVEFKNETLYPTQCYVTHNIATCPGSSGAALFCNLLDMPFMTLFPHRGQQQDKNLELLDERRSGVQTNRFTTFLLNVSGIFAKMVKEASEAYEKQLNKDKNLLQ